MYLKTNQVKKFFRSNNRRISKDILPLIEKKVDELLNNINTKTQGIKTIRPEDII